MVPFFVNNVFEGNNLVQQGKGNSPTEAKDAKALKCSTSNSGHKEIENVVITYLHDVFSMTFEVSLQILNEQQQRILWPRSYCGSISPIRINYETLLRVVTSCWIHLSPLPCSFTKFFFLTSFLVNEVMLTPPLKIFENIGPYSYIMQKI